MGKKLTSDKKNIRYKDLGEIRLQKSTKARKLRISIKPFDSIKVTIPYYVSFQEAEEYLCRKEKWIRQTREKVRNVEKNYTLFNFDSSFNTRDHQLEIIKTDDEVATILIQDGKIQVRCPGMLNIKDPAVQGFIRAGIETAWRKEARQYLIPRLKELAKLNGLEYNKVYIKNNRSRWGSCSHQNNINLSLHLMRLPDRLIDYVLFHELAHTVHKNHSKSFWNLLDRINGAAKKMDRELKKYRIDIY